MFECVVFRPTQVAVSDYVFYVLPNLTNEFVKDEFVLALYEKDSYVYLLTPSYSIVRIEKYLMTGKLYFERVE